LAVTGERKQWLSEDDVNSIHTLVDRMIAESDPVILARMVDELRRIIIIQADRSRRRAN
jgi:hypothetical protein